jgi:hypothetical protein
MLQRHTIIGSNKSQTTLDYIVATRILPVGSLVKNSTIQEMSCVFTP